MGNFFKNVFFKILNDHTIFSFYVLFILESLIILICLPFFMFFIKLCYFICFNFEINAFTFQCFCLDFINRIVIYYSSYLNEKFDFICYLLQFLFGYSFSAANNYLEIRLQLNSFFAFLLALILIGFNFFFFWLWFQIQIFVAIEFFFLDLSNLNKLSIFEIEGFKFYYVFVYGVTKFIAVLNEVFEQFWNIADDFEKMCFICFCFYFCYICYDYFYKKKY